MGTKMAPSYANLFMSELEDILLSSAPNRPLVWWRYIDDIFSIWYGSQDSLDEFINHINAFHPSIKFTANYSPTSVDFLDVTINKSPWGTLTDVYCKPTDTHQSIPPFWQLSAHALQKSNCLQPGLTYKMYLLDRYGYTENAHPNCVST